MSGGYFDSFGLAQGFPGPGKQFVWPALGQIRDPAAGGLRNF
jgi:hypothetical protein